MSRRGGRDARGCAARDGRPARVVARYPDDVLLARLTKALAGARAAGMTVVHVHVALREGGPEVDDHNPIFSTIASDPAFSEGNAGTESHPAVAPRPARS